MTPPVVAFFNNKGGVGKTSLVYHLSWMYAALGRRVLSVDLDPQANLTSAFLREDEMERLWSEEEGEARTIYGCIEPVAKGRGDLLEPALESCGRDALGDDRLAVLPGDLRLSSFEDNLSQEWPGCLNRQERSFRVVVAFSRLIEKAADRHQPDIILVDVGPNLGAINRSAMIACRHVVFPLAPDLFSLQGLKNIGPTLRQWRGEWKERRDKAPSDRPSDLHIPEGRMEPLGYVVMQHSVRLHRPVKAYQKWIERIPETYAEHVMERPLTDKIPIDKDPHCLDLLKHYHSLMPMMQEARKPIFLLTPADGAIGAHLDSVHSAYRDFQRLAEAIEKRVLPDRP